MSELTYGGLVFLFLLALDFAFVIANWMNRIPKVEGYMIDNFNRQELKVWYKQTDWFTLCATFSPIRYVDSAIKHTDIAVEVELSVIGSKPPQLLRLWLDGVKYDLEKITSDIDAATTQSRAVYSAIVSQSDKFTKRHDPILELFH